MKRHTALAIPFGAGDFDPVQPPGAHDLDALRTEAHRVLNCTLHGATEHDPLLELLRDRIGDQLRINLRFADFLDIHVHRHTHEFLQLAAQIFDVLAFLADHDARPGAVYRDLLLQHGREILAVRVPARSPIALYRKPESYRVNFLSHAYSLSPTVR